MRDHAWFFGATEYVRQEHKDYPANNILNGGTFEGTMIEGVVAF